LKTKRVLSKTMLNFHFQRTVVVSYLTSRTKTLLESNRLNDGSLGENATQEFYCLGVA
jgi:hypothetical protein